MADLAKSLSCGIVNRITRRINKTAGIIPQPLTFLPAPAAAYSVCRKLGANHTGNVFKRVSDSVEQTIGFLPDGNIDTATLLTFANGGSVALKTLQDATGNGKNATGASLSVMPLVVQNGVLVLQNLKLSTLFDGSDDVLSVSSIINSNTATINMVFAENKKANVNIPIGGASSNYWGIIDTTQVPVINYYANTKYTTTSYYKNRIINPYSNRIFTNIQNVSTHKLYLNSRLLADTANTFIGGNLSISNIGGFSTYTFDGYFSEAFIWASALSDANRTALENNQKAFYQIGAKYNILCDGDSMTYGIGATTGNAYPFQLLNLINNKDYSITGFGYSGQTVAEMAADASTQIDVCYNSSSQKNILLLLGGTNDIYYNATAQQTYDNIAAYCTARKTAGFKVAVATIMPRSNSGTPAGFETIRQSVNTLLRNNYTNFADVLVDIGNDATMGQPNAQLNTTYFGDQCHPTDAGYAIIANLFRAAVATIVSS